MTSLRGYLKESKELVNSLILTAPLFVIYQIGILFVNRGMNLTDFFTFRLLGALGGNVVAYTAVNLTILAVFGWLYFRKSHERALTKKTWLLLVAESTMWALALGMSTIWLLRKLGISSAAAMALPAASAGTDALGPIEGIVASVGAGTYEELFFRLFLLTALRWGALRLKLKPMPAAAFAVIASSLIFSAAHYVPIGMDSWQLYSFVFRFFMGVFFALLFWYRGFAVAVWTHTIYDIIVIVPRALFGG